ncbi:MAG: serine/threonine protein kinase [Gloeomargaritaceae cyanobacterium C42_A2020_066]|nr:serine/threonine protein kinase [Gloeomargaritaceae cyanobacterium C42_A2020_066]
MTEAGRPHPSPPRTSRVNPDLETVPIPTLDGATVPATDEDAAAYPNPSVPYLPGTSLADFVILRRLGGGGFGHVYMARQVSLDRLVALKVSADRGHEGRTLAQLEHPNIVQVYSETVIPAAQQRLLCMQLVSGMPLNDLIQRLHHHAQTTAGRPTWTGADLLAILDRAPLPPALLNPTALQGREALARMDALEATAYLGVQLAQALQFAHQRGVLHRDIKPANILVNAYGRPLLADFNIATHPTDSPIHHEDMVGGTLAYMAPEHLDALNPGRPDVDWDAVTAQSDVFSLGLVLLELWTGQTPAAHLSRSEPTVSLLLKLAQARRRFQQLACPKELGADAAMAYALQGCLAADPQERWPQAMDLAAQLEGCRQLRRAEVALPPLPPLVGLLQTRPFWGLVVIAVLPQILASLVNITYNATQIVADLTPAQQQRFLTLLLVYNAWVYPLAVGAFVLSVRPVWQVWVALQRGRTLAPAKVDAARRLILKLPVRLAWLTILGWFPGGLIFPWQLRGVGPQLSSEVSLHFLTSFTLSGLVALAYSLAVTQFWVLRVLYPGLWQHLGAFESVVRRELKTVFRRFSIIQGLAGAIPLTAAILVLVTVDGTDATLYRELTVGLILLGGVGYQVASSMVRTLTQVVNCFGVTRA